MSNRDPIITEAILAIGSLRKLAKAIGISPQAVSHWSRIPADRVKDIERVTMIHRSRLRPDIYD